MSFSETATSTILVLALLAVIYSVSNAWISQVERKHAAHLATTSAAYEERLGKQENLSSDQLTKQERVYKLRIQEEQQKCEKRVQEAEARCENRVRGLETELRRARKRIKVLQVAVEQKVEDAGVRRIVEAACEQAEMGSNGPGMELER